MVGLGVILVFFFVRFFVISQSHTMNICDQEKKSLKKKKKQKVPREKELCFKAQ